MTLKRLLWLGLGLRLALFGYSKLHDVYMTVKYTDVDYLVFSGAAAHVYNGSSPYREPTYRYTPLLAYLLLPTVHWSDFGKVLFSLCDLGVAVLIYRLITRDLAYGISCRIRENSGLIAVAIWLFNPLTSVVSTRGNAESLLALMVVSTLYCLNDHNWLIAALLHGLAIHFKIYPLIYLPSTLLFIIENGPGGEDLSEILTGLGKLKSLWSNSVGLVRKCLNRAAILYVVVCCLVFMMLLRLFWGLYGRQFCYETYLYHFERVDIQHNFSPYFYLLRLAENDSDVLSAVSFMAFIPQVVSTVVLALLYYDDLALCWFLTTAFFVTFNKVCTSQYFLWYLCLLPLLVGKVTMTKWAALRLTAVWLLAQGVWLGFAYLLEFQQLKVEVFVFLAGIGFMLCNLFILYRIISCYKLSDRKKID